MKRVKDGRGGITSMATALKLPELRDIECATEIVPPHWVDDDEIIALEARYDFLLFERFADGTLLVTPPAGWASSRRNIDLVWQIENWIRAGNPGLLTGPDGGVGFPDGALLAPDATYVSRERWATADRERTFAYAVPDAAFELLSVSDRITTTRRKIQTYLRNGVRLAVLIDARRRRVHVGREGDAEPQDLGWIERLDCAPAMPGFVLDVAAVCAASDVMGQNADEHQPGGAQTGRRPPQT
jgi:Uma2 family endonuclease